MFVDPALAARIDRAEGRLVSAIASGAASGTVGILDVPFAGGRSILMQPGAPVNKLIGIGFDGPLDEAALAEIEASWKERGEPPRVELATLAPPEVGRQLTARGYRLQGFENVLGRPVEGAPSTPGIRVERASDDAVWMQAVVEGFAHPDAEAVTADEITREALESVMANFVRAPGFLRYVAHVEGAAEAAGGASMRIDGDLAFLCGASTVPRHRRRGVQAALLAARAADAASAGGRLLVVTTAPGSQSQRNVMRQGFALLYARAVLVLEG